MPSYIRGNKSLDWLRLTARSASSKKRIQYLNKMTCFWGNALENSTISSAKNRWACYERLIGLIMLSSSVEWSLKESSFRHRMNMKGESGSPWRIPHFGRKGELWRESHLIEISTVEMQLRMRDTISFGNLRFIRVVLWNSKRVGHKPFQGQVWSLGKPPLPFFLRSVCNISFASK